jgi:hypothetical protein
MFSLTLQENIGLKDKGDGRNTSDLVYDESPSAITTTATTPTTTTITTTTSLLDGDGAQCDEQEDSVVNKQNGKIQRKHSSCLHPLL